MVLLCLINVIAEEGTLRYNHIGEFPDKSLGNFVVVGFIF